MFPFESIDRKRPMPQLQDVRQAGVPLTQTFCLVLILK